MVRLTFSLLEEVLRTRYSVQFWSYGDVILEELVCGEFFCLTLGYVLI